MPEIFSLKIPSIVYCSILGIGVPEIPSFLSKEDSQKLKLKLTCPVKS
jgi:hypothetical protein